jgi:2-polyprenyl-3-methyl-5-hydroxy-6-metoxy-1,4-benzoquinol methylase
MDKITVDLNKPSYYAEPDSSFYRLKRRITYRNILRIIDSIYKEKKFVSLLEIGTGSGFLTSLLEHKYPDVAIQGIEYDNRLVNLTNTKLKRSVVHQGNAEDFNLCLSFDCIVSLQVIEHLYSPESMIDCVLKHLKDNGIFIFTTPNLGCTSNKVMKDNWHGYRIDHVSLKSRKEWDRILLAYGFEKIYSGSTFFTGIPILNKLPLGILNWLLLYFVGSLPWDNGESYVGVFKKINK